MTDPKPIIQEVKVKSGQLLDKVREIIDEGNARRIIIKTEDRTLFEIPMMAGVGGAAAAVLFAPALAAIGALAALVTDVSVVVERDADKDGVAESSTHVFGKEGGSTKEGGSAKQTDQKTAGGNGGASANSGNGGGSNGGASKTMGSEPKA